MTNVLFNDLINNRKQITAVAYARFSSNNQREESIDAQLRAINEYCAREGIHIVETYRDEAKTGTDDNRDDFLQMMDDIMTDRYNIDFVLVHKFNRFARNKIDSAIYKKKLKDRGIRVVSVTQKIEDTPEGELMESIIEAMDEYYSRNLALEVKKGLRENAIKGKFTGGRVPLGYEMSSDGVYIINEQEAEIVRRIFSERALGSSYGQICRGLNTDGILNKQGRKFSITHVKYTLSNEKYIGNYVYKLGNEIFSFMNGEITPAIIDKDTWDIVQHLKQNPNKAPQKRQRAVTYHLTGYLYCLECGLPSSGNGSATSANGHKKYYYRCNGARMAVNNCTCKGVRKDWIENAVFKTIIENVGSPEFIEHVSDGVIAEIQKLVSIPDHVVIQMFDELKDVNSKKERLADLYLEGSFDKETLDRRSAKLNERKYELETAIEKHKSALMTTSITKSDVVEYLISFIKDIDKKSPSDELKSAIFNSFLERVEYDDNDVKIYMKSDFEKMSIISRDNESIAWAIRRLSLDSFKAEMTRKQLKSLGNE